MPLITSTTDLKSLRYGKDRPGGGSSNEPFIKKDIPGSSASFLDQLSQTTDTAQTGFSVGNDFGFRGGYLRPGVAIEDTERILKLYTAQTSPGTIFQAKQVALGLTANPTQVWNPLAIPGQQLLNAIGIGHIPAFLDTDVLANRNLFPPNSIKNNGYGAKGNGESREAFFRMGNPAEGTNNLFKGKLGQTVSRADYTKGVVNVISGSAGSLNKDTSDKMTLQPLYNSTNGVKKEVPDDYIKFYISIVDNNKPSQRTYIHFRAYITGFNDSFASSWNPVNYVGRGDSFYTYGGGFKRTISLNFDVFCQSRQEQGKMYEKLNYLASTLAPDYNNAGVMRGSLMYLTVGDYLVDVPGFIQGLTFTPNEGAGWEIARNPDGTIDNKIKQLPHLISVSGFQFTAIENFLPQKEKIDSDSTSPFIGFSTGSLGNSNT